jgi:IS1 family transposase
LDKKNEVTVESALKTLELDELYWFVGEKSHAETRENVYLITMVSCEPRQIVGFDVAFDKSPPRIQQIVDNAPPAEKYCTDGYLGYIDIVYPGCHLRNIHDKSDTHNVESVNADLRHYIPVLRRRSRCFCRSIETLSAVVSLFVEAYNKFGNAKLRCRVPVEHISQDHKKHLHKFREVGFSFLDFL